ncbi:hypothetical protein BDQ12DRAFT_734952 [Crucibulum laeve]|uniref:Organic solute transporter Ostalpha-domain-containing protein n=1 Tax=Crucibulum laeve TaxID=68775 RepID=A0A5C3M359_9AGAR|nr:hypothetical protein BDQ12DRAFT_734952 [Crucibulum laeve]
MNAPEEYIQIWQRPWSHIKFLYVFSRYFALAAQLVERMLLSSVLFQQPISPNICRPYYYFQTVVVMCILATLELVLMLRVYAFYNQDKKVGLLFIVVFITETGCNFIFGIRRVYQVEFDAACIIESIPRSVVGLGATVAFTQCLIWGMTILKDSGLARYQLKAVPIVRVMKRDGVLVFIAISAMVSVSIPYTVLVKQTAHVVPQAVVTVFSVMTCHLILNMQRLKTLTCPSDNEDMEFTTILENTTVSFDSE